MQLKNTFTPSGLAELMAGKRTDQSLLNGKGERRKHACLIRRFLLAYMHVAECRRWKADFARKMARRSPTVNISHSTVQHALSNEYAEEEAETSGAGSTYASESEGERDAGVVQHEQARRVNHTHRHHSRRSGSGRNRQHRTNGERHDASRGGSNPRGRRVRRRRRRD